MRSIVILGAGTAGTIMANRLRRTLNPEQVAITVVDRNDRHVYQPGLLFVPFHPAEAQHLVKPRREFLPQDVDFLEVDAERIEADQNEVLLMNGERLPYDVLVIATGSRIVPEETPGLVGEAWQRSIFDFYTPEGSARLAQALQGWPGGRLVIHIQEMPIKCPVAPLEFAFLADAHFRHLGMRERVQISYVTPLPGAFTRPVATRLLGQMLQVRDIGVVPEFNTERVDGASRTLWSFDGRSVPFDLLVTIPTHMGDPLIERSGLGDELGFVPTHPKTLQSRACPNIFAVGDATNIAVSKAGSVAHFEAEVLAENIHRFLRGEPLAEAYDGHTNCFIETGDGKGLLIDFNEQVEPLPGTFPVPGLGPLSLLRESRFNHWGKLAFRWVYWHLLLRGRHIPLVSTAMSLR
ncbi:MAG TPA: FAD/NAD(P)-binding oxidoreductase, partial [bacterium]|nr:FAD/NAD(P)-binding oxidoreductase [bacterium]